MTPFARTLIQAATALAAILAFWTVASLRTEPFLLPTPNATLAKSASLLATSEFVRHAGASVMILLQGFLPAILFAIGLGAAAAKSKPMRWIAESFATVPAAAPLIVFATPLVLWQGIGTPAKIVLVFLVSAFPMLLNFLAVLKSSGSATADEAAPTATLTPLISRATLSSVRLGLTLGVGAAMVAEMLASQEGLGYLLTTYTANLDAAALMGTLVVILAPTALVGVLLQAIEEQMVV